MNREEMHCDVVKN
ncbi:hypothetical protein KYD87_21305 [Escherichia fergusonii]|nr:hypothetical protein KYD87_21305 [Escherichia fergusonii]UAT42130.1 hypothetical protein KYC43_05875 [Escherichia fergusonii]